MAGVILLLGRRVWGKWSMRSKRVRGTRALGFRV